MKKINQKKSTIFFLFPFLFVLTFLISNSVLINRTKPIGQKEKIYAADKANSEGNNDNLNQFLIDEIIETKLFSNNNLKTEKQITLLVTGDVNLGRSVNLKMINATGSAYPFTKTSQFIKKADISLINLETPLKNKCPPSDTGMVFCSEDDNALSLLSTGIDIASLGNNHSQDQGKDGLTQTKLALIKNGIQPLNNGASITYKLKGKTLVFLTYDLVWHKFDLNEMKRSIIEAKNRSDLVIPFFHWGSEYTADPSKLQKEVAHAAIDSGADLILGNHPHWVQAFEIYHAKLIVYSHGNFVFDQMWSKETREGMFGLYTFSNNKLVEAKFTPIWIADNYQPELADQKTSEKIMGRIKAASSLINKKN